MTTYYNMIKSMEPAELIQWRQSRRLTLEELGRALGVTKGCLSRWESGERKIPPFLHLALRCLELEGGDLKRKPGEYPTGQTICLIREGLLTEQRKRKMKKEV